VKIENVERLRMVIRVDAERKRSAVMMAADIPSEWILLMPGRIRTLLQNIIVTDQSRVCIRATRRFKPYADIRNEQRVLQQQPLHFLILCLPIDLVAGDCVAFREQICARIAESVNKRAIPDGTETFELRTRPVKVAVLKEKVKPAQKRSTGCRRRAAGSGLRLRSGACAPRGQLDCRRPLDAHESWIALDSL
jgi:hypothetical protein